MQFTVKTEDLVKALNIVKGTFGSKAFPSLNNIYMQADIATGEVTFKASNANESSSTVFPASVTNPGDALIDGFTLTRVVSTFADGDVTFTKTLPYQHVEVDHPKGSLEISGEEPTNFINPSEMVTKSTFMIPSKELKDALQAVAFARANGHINNKLNGVAVVSENGNTTLYASDTTRVAKFVFATPAAADANVVISHETIKGLSAVSGNIAVNIADNAIQFQTNESTYQSNVLATGFPPQVNNYFTLAPHATLFVDRHAFHDMLTRVSILSKAGKDDPHADFHFKSSNELEVSFSGTRGKVKSEKLATEHTGPDVTLTLSVDKLLESVNRIDKDRLLFEFPQGKQNQVKALTIYPEGTRDYAIFNMAVTS